MRLGGIRLGLGLGFRVRVKARCCRVMVSRSESEGFDGGGITGTLLRGGRQAGRQREKKG